MRIDGGRWPLRLSLLCWEMVTTFLNTLKDPYYARLIGPTSSSFADLVIVGDRIEDGIKSGRLVYTHLLQTIVEQQSEGLVREGHPQRETPPRVRQSTFARLPLNPIPGPCSRHRNQTFHFLCLGKCYNRTIQQLPLKSILSRQLKQYHPKKQVHRPILTQPPAHLVSSPYCQCHYHSCFRS